MLKAFPQFEYTCRLRLVNLDADMHNLHVEYTEMATEVSCDKLNHPCNGVGIVSSIIKVYCSISDNNAVF